MKNLDIKSLTKALEEQNFYWICPVTGKKINSKDTAVIEAHKVSLIQTATQAETIKQQQKEIKKIKEQYNSISTLSELNQWFVELLTIKYPDMDTQKMPKLSVESTKSFKEAPSVGTDYGVIKLSHVPHGYTKEFKRIEGLTFIKDSKNNATYLHTSAYSNKLGKKVFDYQKSMLLEKGISKVGLPDRILLDQSSAYQGLKEQIKDTNKQLHDLHQHHNIINDQMKKLRDQIIMHKLFDDAEEKTVKTNKNR